jgi:preprotein translocase subunit SecD
MIDPHDHAARLAPDVRVWDGLLRLAHWSFPLLILAMWWTAENDKWAWHRRLGLVLLGVLAFRVLWGFIAIAVFMCGYYLMFGIFSTLALAFNLLLLVASLSLLQATLTLPGIAAIALTLGMAIDANVLINERIREELRSGAAPQTAIHLGYDRAFATILDSNITTLIAGVSLLAFGSGPVRGFAVVHCLGILTSMFSAVMFSRGLVNLWYGRQKKLKKVSIGQVWKPQSEAGAPANI